MWTLCDDLGVCVWCVVVFSLMVVSTPYLAVSGGCDPCASHPITLPLGSLISPSLAVLFGGCCGSLVVAFLPHFVFKNVYFLVITMVRVLTVDDGLLFTSNPITLPAGCLAYLFPVSLFPFGYPSCFVVVLLLVILG